MLTLITSFFVVIFAGNGGGSPDRLQEQELLSVLDFSPIAGSKAKFEASGDEVEYEVEYEVETIVTPNHVHNVGICGFNEPDDCTHIGGFAPGTQCGPLDVFLVQGDPFCYFGGADIADDEGELEIEGVVDEDTPLLLGTGLSDPIGAEVIVFVMTLGPVIPGRLEEQLTEVDGGCDVNDCTEVQISPFAAP